jgi:hypothetical protein
MIIIPFSESVAVFSATLRGCVDYMSSIGSAAMLWRNFLVKTWGCNQGFHKTRVGIQTSFASGILRSKPLGKKKDVTSMKKFTVGVFSNKNYRSFVPTMAIQAAKQWGISSDLAVPRIPKVIHQIWVGPKEPPCLWLDTFRSDYLEAGG